MREVLELMQALQTEPRTRFSRKNPDYLPRRDKVSRELQVVSMAVGLLVARRFGHQVRNDIKEALVRKSSGLKGEMNLEEIGERTEAYVVRLNRRCGFREASGPQRSLSEALMDVTDEAIYFFNGVEQPREIHRLADALSLETRSNPVDAVGN